MSFSGSNGSYSFRQTDCMGRLPTRPDINATNITWASLSPQAYPHGAYALRLFQYMA